MFKENEKHIWKIMNCAEKVKEIIWQKFGVWKRGGFLKKSEEFLWKK